MINSTLLFHEVPVVLRVSVSSSFLFCFMPSRLAFTPRQPMARNTWNTYQLDVYIDDGGEISLGASASNTQRSGGHEKDEKTASTFAKKLGFSNAKITPIGEQHSGR